MSRREYRVDPADPRAPSRTVWEELSEAERRRVVDSLPAELPRALPPEGDRHSIPKRDAFDALEQFFRRRGRSVYLSTELAVYYPDESPFAPDLLAVLDVDPHPRDRWVVSDEGRGLDFVLEIHVAGDERKDRVHNVERYARLGIPEYFTFAPTRRRLLGYSLETGNTYTAIVPQGGMWRSRVLGLDLALDDARLRFYDGTAALPDARELIGRLSTMVDGAVERAEEEARRAEEEARRAEEEARRAEEEARRAEEEARRAARYSAKLRELGIDPDSLD